MKTILNHIKEKNLKPVYLLYGEEAYLKLQYKDKLLEVMTDPEDTMNFQRFEGKDIDVQEVLALADTMPFFADYRTILIIDSGWFKSSCDEMAEYLKQPAETVRILFVEKEVDKRSNMFKAVNHLGYAAEFKEQNEATLRQWIQKMAGKEGKEISSGAVELLLLRTGSDMNNIRNEIEKVFCYTEGRNRIVESDIEAVVSTRVVNHIFDMIAAISTKQQKKALNLYYELLALKEPPMKILALLSRQFNILLQAKELRMKGYDKSGIARKMQITDWLTDKYLQQAKEFKFDTLKTALEDCVEAEEAVKTGRMTDRLSVEMLIVKYSV